LKIARSGILASQPPIEGVEQSGKIR
jgi:hypothetical protein